MKTFGEPKQYTYSSHKFPKAAIVRKKEEKKIRRKIFPYILKFI